MKKTLLVALLVFAGVYAYSGNNKSNITSVGTHSCVGNANDYQAYSRTGKESGRRTDMKDFQYAVFDNGTMMVSYKMGLLPQGTSASNPPKITVNTDKVLEASVAYESKVITDPTNGQKWIRSVKDYVMIDKTTGQLVRRQSYTGLNVDHTRNGNGESWEVTASSCS